MTNTIKIKGITFKIHAEEKLTGKAKGFFVSIMSLTRLNGTKEFWAMRDINGTVTLN